MTGLITWLRRYLFVINFPSAHEMIFTRFLMNFNFLIHFSEVISCASLFGTKSPVVLLALFVTLDPFFTLSTLKKFFIPLPRRINYFVSCKRYQIFIVSLLNIFDIERSKYLQRNVRYSCSKSKNHFDSSCSKGLEVWLVNPLHRIVVKWSDTL